jgi:DNA-binding IscR family transcriptional regulator
LTRPPDEISLGEVVAVIEGPPESGSDSGADSPAARVLAETWREITTLEQQVLSSVSLAVLIEQARKQGETMYYI